MRIRTRSKYGSKKTTVDGIKFDSKAEAEYYLGLKLLKRSGDVLDFEMQVEFVLIPAYVNAQGQKVRETKYRADFIVTYKDGHQEIIDVKGHKTPEYVLKKKLFEYQYRDKVIKEVNAS